MIHTASPFDTLSEAQRFFRNLDPSTEPSDLVSAQLRVVGRRISEARPGEYTTSAQLAAALRAGKHAVGLVTFSMPGAQQDYMTWIDTGNSGVEEHAIYQRFPEHDTAGRLDDDAAMIARDALSNVLAQLRDTPYLGDTKLPIDASNVIIL